MSGLGTTVDPSGEPGSQTHNVIPQSETVPDQPGTIVQSTAIQTLDQLLHTNWIFDSTFTASTNMPAGTILFVKPIHPMEWNWPNKRVASMFNVWTGSGKIRYRPLATAWYGGSIRVGFLPPNLSLAEVQNMPLEVLTSYPNKDIDPKNTAWVDFRGPDQREVSYHYMSPFDDKDRQNFGGYIVFYVAGKLVTQAPEFTTIQFIVELAGDFMYDQPSPKALTPAAAVEQPLGAAVMVNLHYQPICDSLDAGRSSVVQVLPSAVNAILGGGGTMSSVGVRRSLTKNVPGLVPRNPAAWIAASDTPSTFNNWVGPGQSNFWSEITADSVNHIPHVNREFTDDTQFINYAVNHDDTPQIHHFKKLVPKPTNTGKLTPDTYPIGSLFVDKVDVEYSSDFLLQPDDVKLLNGSNHLVPINTALTPDRWMTLTPNASGESIVIFANLTTRNYAPQTITMAEELAKWPKDQSGDDISWLYNLVNASGTPLLTIRLNPNGMFTTNPVSAAVLYTNRTLYLRYVGTLPLSSPLPPQGIQQANLRRLLARHSRAVPVALDEIEFEVEQM